VGLDHEALQAQVHRLLGEFQEVFPVTAHVGRIGKEREVRITGPQFDGDLPARGVAVLRTFRRGETAVDDAEFPHAGAVQALQRPDPQVQIRIDRILHEDRDVRVLERIGHLLHQEGIGAGTCPHPEHVHTVLKAFIHMLFGGDFAAYLHAGLLLYLLEPLEAGRSHPLEAPRVRPGFPDARPEYMDASCGEVPGRFHHLLFAFRAAGTRDHHRPREREESPFTDGDDIQCFCHTI